MLRKPAALVAALLLSAACERQDMGSDVPAPAPIVAPPMLGQPIPAAPQEGGERRHEVEYKPAEIAPSAERSNTVLRVSESDLRNELDLLERSGEELQSALKDNNIDIPLTFYSQENLEQLLVKLEALAGSPIRAKTLLLVRLNAYISTHEDFAVRFKGWKSLRLVHEDGSEEENPIVESEVQAFESMLVRLKAVRRKL